MFNPDDAFGKMMVKNFKSRGIPLFSINFFQNLKKITKSFTGLGFDCSISSVQEIYYNKIKKEEIGRISKLEWIDEFEEFNLMTSHYFVSICKKCNGKSEGLKKLGFANLSD